MNTLALIGIILAIYGLAVIGLAIKRPEPIWKMKKIQVFIKILGEKGTLIFFYIFGGMCLISGITLMLQK